MLKICDLCSLDKQCCIHNKDSYNNSINCILAKCESQNYSPCICRSAKVALMKTAYYDVLNTIPREIFIKPPKHPELITIYNKYIVVSNNVII